MDSDEIVRRIEQSLGTPGLAEMLASRVSPTDLQSLLLAVYRKRSAARSPAAVLAEYESNRFVAPSGAKPEQLELVEAELRKCLPSRVEQLELSPVCPLGTSSILAGVSQDWSVPTARNTEVVSDATNVLALECALQRRKAVKASPKSVEEFHYCTSHRLLRPQFYDSPNLLAHFRLFHICSAGRDSGNIGFESSTIVAHASTYLKALQHYTTSGTEIEFLLTDFHRHDRNAYLDTNILQPLRHAFAGLRCGVNEQRTAGHGYYRDLCFHINVLVANEDTVQLADGGSVDWTQKALGNAKERLVISAISSERMCGLRT